MLAIFDSFFYLGGQLSKIATIDKEIERRIASASAVYGRLRVGSSKAETPEGETRGRCGIQCVVMSVLLYGIETWTVHRHHLRSLEPFSRGVLGVL